MKFHLSELLQGKESEYLEFKYDMYEIYSSDLNRKVLERMELLRDILSLMNIKRIDIDIDESYLIIGIGETNEKYNGRHKNINFVNDQTIIQLVQKHLDPSLTIEFKEFFLSGDKDNVSISEYSLPNYDRILIIILKRQKGVIYEFKKEIGNQDVGFERLGASYTRDCSHKRRIREIDRQEIREYPFVNVNLKLNEDQITKKLKTIYHEEFLNKKLNKVKNAILDDFENIKSMGTTNRKNFIADVEYYITKLKKFIIARNEHFKKINKIINFGIEIENESELVLKNIDVYIGSGKDCELIEKKPRFKEKPPNRDLCFREKSVISDILSSVMPAFSDLVNPTLNQINSNNYTINEEKNIITFHIDMLKQGYITKIPKILVKVPWLVNNTTLRISVVITIGEPYKTITENLDLLISYQ